MAYGRRKRLQLYQEFLQLLLQLADGEEEEAQSTDISRISTNAEEAFSSQNGLVQDLTHTQDPLWTMSICMS